MNYKTKALWLFFIILIYIDLKLAFASWDDIRNSVGWVKIIPQKTEFKLRHIVQYTPQTIWLCLCMKNTFKISNRYISLIAIVFISSIGALTEVIQLYRPQRIFSYLDMFWNFFAACLGVLIYNTYLQFFKKVKNVSKT
jgi:hypothetical protein